MQCRTDLAGELLERGAVSGVRQEKDILSDVRITRITVPEDVADAFGKAAGKYVTLRWEEPLSTAPPEPAHVSVLADELRALLPPQGTVLVLGLGNAHITPDALGARAVRHIITTRGRTLPGVTLREVCALAPGVFGQTGLEAAEVLRGLLDTLHPAAVIAIDALAAGDIARLGNSVQVSDAGISPGSGVENRRPELSAQTLGVPVLAIGVPTVVDFFAPQNAQNKTDAPPLFVTPRDVDLLTERAAKLIALAVNQALQPALAAEELAWLSEG
ncbi:MAG: GPR endopeptidase [Oscillospiraceae bacterium]|jgi:spore protease|nr:GPR endopeptidase [Oscillospiraceae bacterium]